MSLEQLKKREKSLEAEVKRLTEELAEALKLIKELQGKERTKSEIFLFVPHKHRKIFTYVYLYTYTFIQFSNQPIV